MSAPADLEGLPWPDGDPGGLRAAAGEAAAVAVELDARRAHLVGLSDPLGWQGAAEASFAASVAAHGESLNRAAGDFAGAAHALLSLAGVIEQAQATVTKAAKKLHDAREALRLAQAKARQARAEATRLRAAANASASPLGPLDPAAIAAGAAEGDAIKAENAEQAAQREEERVSRWAHQVAAQAVADAHRADHAAAGALHGAAGVAAGPAGMPVAAGPGGPPATPLSALGSYLLHTRRGESPAHAPWLAQPVRALPGIPDAGGADPGDGADAAERWAGMGFGALMLDGLREGIFKRTELLAEHAPGGQLVPPELLPSWIRGTYSSAALRSGLKWGLPIIGVGTGSVLDYEQARAEGHSVAGSVRRTVVNDVGTFAGTWGGRAACGLAAAATSESGGWGAVACPVLVPAGAWLGHKGGEVANTLIDKASGVVDEITGGHDKPPVIYSGPADPSQLAAPPDGGAYG